MDLNVGFFIATNGNDEWSGTLAEPNDKQSDGSFATLTKARDAVRAYKKQNPGSSRGMYGHLMMNYISRKDS